MLCEVTLYREQKTTLLVKGEGSGASPPPAPSGGRKEVRRPLLPPLPDAWIREVCGYARDIVKGCAVNVCNLS